MSCVTVSLRVTGDVSGWRRCRHVTMSSCVTGDVSGWRRCRHVALPRPLPRASRLHVLAQPRRSLRLPPLPRQPQQIDARYVRAAPLPRRHRRRQLRPVVSRACRSCLLVVLSSSSTRYMGSSACVSRRQNPLLGRVVNYSAYVRLRKSTRVRVSSVAVIRRTSGNL